MFGKRERSEAGSDGEGMQKFKDIYGKRKKFVTECSDDVVAAADSRNTVAVAYFSGQDIEVEGITATKAEEFNFIYSKNAAERMQDLSHFLLVELSQIISLRTLGYYKKLFSDLVAEIESLRSAVREYYGEMPRDFESHQPNISVHTSLQHYKDFSEGIRKIYKIQYRILLDNIRRAENGRDNPDVVRWKGKEFDDELREDLIFFKTLLKDIDNKTIKSKKKLFDVARAMYDEAGTVADPASERLKNIHSTDAGKRVRFRRKDGKKFETRTSVKDSARAERDSSISRETKRPPVYLTTLGISLEEYRNADFDTLLKRRYRELIEANHPDTAGRDGDLAAQKTEITKKITEAYEVLKNPEKRRKYMAFWEQGRKD